jgi:hypothetical protein
VQRTTATAEAAGDVEHKLKLTKRAVRKIVKRRKFDLPVAITYTPTGGDPKHRDVHDQDSERRLRGAA